MAFKYTSLIKVFRDVWITRGEVLKKKIVKTIKQKSIIRRRENLIKISSQSVIKSRRENNIFIVLLAMFLKFGNIHGLLYTLSSNLVN